MAFEVAGGETVGWVSGEGDPIALLLHGGPGMSDYTDDFAREVAAALPDHRIARYQQRGLAPSSRTGPFTVAQLVDDLFAVVDHLDATRLVLVGHSWGGHLAMHAAVARPTSVDGVVLLDSLGAIGDGGQSTFMKVIASRIGVAAVAEVIALVESDLSPLEAGTAQIRLAWPGYFADPSSAPDPPPIAFDLSVNAATMADANALLAAGVLAGALPSLSVPSVHVIGRASPIDPAANRATAAAWPGATSMELDCGHFTWIERPGSVSEAVQALGAT